MYNYIIVNDFYSLLISMSLLFNIIYILPNISYFEPNYVYLVIHINLCIKLKTSINRGLLNGGD